MPRRPHLSRALAPAAAVAAALALVTGCGSDGDGGSRTQPESEVTATPAAQAAAPSADAEVIRIKLQGGTTDPSGSTVQVKLNQPVVLDITADEAGELHVHSSPEQHVSFPSGDSRVTLTVDKPGLVEIEDHDLDKVIVELEVR